MTNERHEKALEAAAWCADIDWSAALSESNFASTPKAVEAVIATYLQAMDAVIVPIAASEEMEIEARIRVKPFHDLNEREWRSMMPADLFRLAWPAMLAAAPQHFTTGE